MAAKIGTVLLALAVTVASLLFTLTPIFWIDCGAAMYSPKCIAMVKAGAIFWILAIAAWVVAFGVIARRGRVYWSATGVVLLGGIGVLHWV